MTKREVKSVVKKMIADVKTINLQSAREKDRKTIEEALFMVSDIQDKLSTLLRYIETNI